MANAALAPAGFSPKRRSLAELVAREARRRRQRRFFALGVVALVVVGAVAAWLRLRPKPVPYAGRFRAEPVTVGDVLRDVRATGHVEAVTTVQVGAEISGRVATVEVDYNDTVKAGQVLARFDRASLLAQVAQVQATLAAARAGLEQAKTDRERTGRDLGRIDELFKSGSLSATEHDNAHAAARMAEQRVAAAEAQVGAQQAAYNLAKTNLDHGVILAPIDGVVITRNIDPGQTVASVFQTPVLFTVAADLRQMRVIAAVDEADIGEVARDQPAFFTVNAYPDRVFEGVVTEVRNSPVVVQDVVTYGAVLEVANPDLALKPGMTASARIRTAAARGVTRVPSAALRFAPPGSPRDDAPGVWLLEGADAHRVVVRPGISDGEFTAIDPGPLAPGARVLVDLTPEGRKAYGLAR